MASNSKSSTPMERYGYDVLLGSIAAFYVIMIPYTKVEESFNVQLASFRDLFQDILLLKSPKFAKLFAFIAWSIWFKSNAQRVGSLTILISKIYKDVVERRQEYQMVQDSPLPSPLVAHPAHWLPHSLNQYKANCDGAVFRDINSAGLGVVIRDSVGLIIATLSERICLPSTVDELEALACRRVVAFALKNGLHEVAFEGDSEVVFKQLNAKPPCLASYGHIIEESQILALNLSFASFSHVKRSGNVVTDKLAKLAKHVIEPQIWLEDIHSDATNIVTLDKKFLPI
nr:isoform 5 of dol-p-man:man(7)glcnac(2)-pp-dol alpha-1,6-mannosyltransferase [Quercus suber]